MLDRARELSRDGMNDACVDCGDAPFGGGMRCLPCMGKYVAKRRERVRAGLKGSIIDVHTCGKHRPSLTCYVKCRCRCRTCRDYELDRERRRRERARSAA